MWKIDFWNNVRNIADRRRESMKISKAISILASIFVIVSAECSVSRAQSSEKCESTDGFLILKNQKYALSDLARCLIFNQVAYSRRFV